MSLPWHIPLESLPSLKEKEGPIETTQLKHYCNLNIHENPSEEVQTGLMCEIGMNNREPAVLQRLIASGMTVARLNLRDLEPDSCDHLIQSIRQAVYNYSAELEYVYPLALIVDVRGPDIVTGDLKGGPKTMIELIEHETIRLTTDPSWRECGTAECLFVGYDHLTDLQPGDILFIDSLMSGKVKLVILAVGDDSIECKIVIGGAVGPKMAVRLSKVPRENDSSNKKGRESLDSVSCPNWSLISGYSEGQTISAKADYKKNVIWNQPIDLHYVSKGIQGWPKIVLQVNCLDSLGRSWIVGYGSCNIPAAPGQHLIKVPCWVPAATTVTDKLRQMFIGGAHELSQTDIVNLGCDRFKLNTQSKGDIELRIYIILRNFNQFGVEYK
ncbi:pyruvate kinase isoform X2 [Bicyclus anynana]|uniref:Pyruvate kinase isoform X2 n=1 Tax=Bicyclus anynana TaxID=110368 RepID=A0ABM3M8C2_BICAN|nr:pyruvate kinase isoform X2 [Bicyclus anynana]